jgi:tetratricopeptide (TPR) repeat protein
MIAGAMTMTVCCFQKGSESRSTLLRAILVALTIGSQFAAAEVQLWETNEVIPTYVVGPPDPNPRFYSGRTYQGARATFYPYPVLDKLTDERQNKSYRLVYLENEYVQLAVMPELGGRIFIAKDKSNDYDFFYRQHVIKPALIGMLGAWISGGVEWNVPHHHRATSFMPVDYTLETRPDGSKTVWIGETEWRHRLKWIIGVTLYPGRSYIEMSARIFNRTPYAHPILFWINPGVHANEKYQVLFPPDVEFAVQHGKPEFAHWPIGAETYAGVDYRGVDLSWWKNHPSPVSFFAWDSQMDFFGGYDHGRQAGVLHYADHHQVPGKKFFEWGNGPEGEMWMKVLTDNDGPYLELMAGAWSDNQPDYSWLQPGEVKTWRHYWYPIRQLGGASNATIDAAVNLTVSNRTARIAFNATGQFRNARATLHAGKTGLFERAINISPREPFVAEVQLPEGVTETDLRLALLNSDGRELVAYQPVARKDSPMPKPVARPRPPGEIQSNEELYLTGLRIEQLYSPSFEPAPYYEEAVRRDAGDIRANTALGILRAKEWRWADAEKHLRAAIDRASANYIRPKDSEADYYLGVVLRAQGRFDEASAAFHRAAWGQAWQSPANLALAQIECLRRNFGLSLELVNRVIAASSVNTKARNLKSAVLRRLGRAEEAEEHAVGTIALDPLDFGALNELALAQRQRGAQSAAQTLAHLQRLMRNDPQSYLELAADYEQAGLWEEAIELLLRTVGGESVLSNAHPLIYYHLGYCAEMAGQGQSLKYYKLAARMSPDFCFPFREEEERILQKAIERNPDDARGWYYLGNLLFDRQPQRAIQAWENSRKLADNFALVHRNLGLAYAQTHKDFARAIECLQRAVELNPKEPRFFYELDLQLEAAGAPVTRRLSILTNNHDVVKLRDDALSRELALLVAAGRHDLALDVMFSHHFHNWEGSSEIHALYADALLARGHAKFKRRQFNDAFKDYVMALEYPSNLEVGRPKRDRKAAQVFYYVGLTQEALNDAASARESFERSVTPREHGPSEAQFYQALALKKLGKTSDAQAIFEGLVRQGESLLKAGDQPDYFAKFGERQSERVRQANAYYLAALGKLGMGRTAEAEADLGKAIGLHPGHLGALCMLNRPPL